MANLFRVTVPVPDIEGATRFYTEVLGQRGRRVAPKRHYFDCGGVILALVDPTSHDRGFTPNPDAVYFAVPELEAVFARADKADADEHPEDDVGWGIRERPWGERSFYIRDPYGNPLCFVDESTVFTGDAAPD